MNELPEGWAETTLGEVADWGSGGTPSRSEPSFYGGTIPWIKSGELNSRYITTTEEFITEAAIKNSSAKLFPAGSVAIAMYGATIGKTAIFGVNASTNQACAVGAPAEGVIGKEFLYRLLQNEKEAFIEKGKGGAQPNISQAVIKAHEIYLPPQAEQIRIAQKLDELLAQVDTLKARIDAIPTLLKRFRQSVLTAAISGRLAEESNGRSESTIQCAKAPLGTLIREMRNGLSAKPNENGEGVPILRISSVRVSSVDQADIRFLECTDAEKNRYSLNAGDLLFTRYNGSLELVGVCGLIRQLSHTTLVYPDKLIRVRCNTDIVLPEYLEIFFSAPSTRQQVMELVKSTSGQKGISGQDLKDFDVTYPSLSIQLDVVRRVEQLFAFADQLEAKVASAKACIDHLTQSILAKAFRGELVPQDPNDEPACVLLERIKAQRAAAPKAKRGRKASA